MKKHFLRCTVACALLTGLPVIPLALHTAPPAVQADAAGEAAEKAVPETEADEQAEPSAAADEAAAPPVDLSLTESYRVLDVGTGEVIEVSVRDYVIGAVGAEMPASFAPEALKAQAVAAHTYAQRQAMLAPQRPELGGADFSNDPAQYQAFYTVQQLRELYGQNFDAYYEKLCGCVDAVLGELLIYEQEPIIAAFHAISSGRTESAENVWGSQVAYLCSVDSSADEQAPLYEQSVTCTADEVREKLEAAHSGIALGADPAGWFGEPVCTEAGTVMQLQAGNSIFTGQELRRILSLRSAAFTVQYADGSFTFTTHGYGHAVGMSQYGANAMAIGGADYREILAYYYPGTELVNAAEP